MSIVNKELIGRGVEGEREQLNEPLGRWILKILLDNYKTHKDMTWMTDLSNGKSMTYGALIESIYCIGNALQKRGFRPNDTLFFIANNHLEMAIAYLAVWFIGGCSVSLGVSCFSAEEFYEIIRSKTIETGSKFILTDLQGASQCQNALQDLSGVDVIVIGGHVANCIFFDDLLLEGRIIRETNEYEADNKFNSDGFNVESPICMIFSSGTTGAPKCIVHTHKSFNNFAAYHRSKGVIRNPTRENKLTTNGMVHVSGISMIVYNILDYGHQFILSEANRTGESLLQAIHKSKVVTVSIYPAEIIQICSLNAETLSKYDLSSVQSLRYTGTNITSIYRHRLSQIMPNLKQLANGYGCSEARMITTPLPPSSSRDTFLELLKSPLSTSVGKVSPSCKLKFLDLKNNEKKVGPNEFGEIAFKTPYLMLGYLNKPEETNKVIRDGWYYTGDVGYYDPDGNVFLLGRVADLIRYKSYYVSPCKIEEQMILHPKVKDVAVIGAPNHQDGEHPTAFVTLKNSQDACETISEEIKLFTIERVTEEEKIRGSINFIDHIPRNGFGKIARYELTKRL